MFSNLYTYRWSYRLNDLEHIVHVYFRSSLCVSLCLARALELLNNLLQTGQRIIDLPPLHPSTDNFADDLPLPDGPTLPDDLRFWPRPLTDLTEDGDLNPTRLTGDSVSRVDVSPVHDKNSTEFFKPTRKKSSEVTYGPSPFKSITTTIIIFLTG